MNKPLYLSFKPKHYLEPSLNYQKKKVFLTEISRIGQFSKKVDTNTRNLLNEYQTQFKAKQHIKKLYGDLSETKLKLLIKKNKISVINLIEKRFDVVVFRLGFAKTIKEAKYLINTNKIKINGSANISDHNYILSNGDIISTTDISAYESKIIHLNGNIMKLPSHLMYLKNKKELTGIIIKDPIESEILLPRINNESIALEKFKYFVNRYS